MGCCGNSDDSDEKYGKSRTYEPDFKGPTKNRSCTDIICCLIFMVFIFAYMVVSIFAWVNGNPLILIHPTDTQGRICGLQYKDMNLTGKNSLFYFDVTKCTSAQAIINFQCPTTQICVSSCPNEYWTYYIEKAKLTAALVGTKAQRETAASLVDWSKLICVYGYNPRDEFITGKITFDGIFQQEKCAAYYVPYSNIFGRCIPFVDEATKVLEANVSGVSQPIQDASGTNVTYQSLLDGVQPIKLYLEARTLASKIFSDLTNSWITIIILLTISAVVALLWILLMRCLSGPIIWSTIIGFIGLASFGVYYTYNEWQKLKSVPESKKSIISVGFTTDLSAYLALRDTWLAFLIILSVIDGIFILIILFLRKRIQIAIEVIDQASKAVLHIISSLFYPLYTTLLCLIVFGFWAITALFLASTGSPIYKYIDMRTTLSPSDENLTGKTCDFDKFSSNTTLSSQPGLKCEFLSYGGESVFHNNIFWLQFAMLFGMLWLMNWVLALGQCTLAGAFSSYYWARDKSRDLPMFPVYQSLGRSLRYHTGSIAFGSFIIALVQLVRIILEYIDHKVKGSENKVAKFIMKCMKCCLYCLEKFLKFLNRNAYIMISIYGKNFCWSAKEAFQLLMRNILRAAVLDKIVDFVLLIGKLFVTAGMTTLCWALFTDKIPFYKVDTSQLNYYWMPIILVGITTFFIATGFFNVFGMAADTIFLCFLEDLERNDGSVEKPYFMGKGLRKVLGKKNKKPKNEK